MTLVLFAPNWLGDAVMALPAIEALRAHHAAGRVVVAARRSVAPLFDLLPGVDAVVPLGGGGGVLTASRLLAADVRAVAAVRADVAVLFPNSFRSALTARLAGIPVRWGVRRSLRGPLVSHAVPRPPGSLHQIDAYRQTARALGAADAVPEPRLTVPDAVAGEAARLLADAGWDGHEPLIGFGPGAAFGSAKRWPEERVASVIAAAASPSGPRPVLVGAPADAPTAAGIVDAVRRLDPACAARMLNLVGATSLPRLAGVLARCRAFVTNDSGAMHLAAAVGTPVVALFGPTTEGETAPRPRPGVPAVLLAGRAWCRPCGLRECPLDHRCMTSLEPSAVLQALAGITKEPR